jgi:hypothetical protein
LFQLLLLNLCSSHMCWMIFRYIRVVNPLIGVSSCSVRIVTTIFLYKSTFMRRIQYNIFNWHGVSLFSSSSF